ncbi:DUF4238 domain-containing protein [Sphingomonas sp. MG17]|uniref:DUF4238 domain-containing protein n=1 Tax=Sphingomonas tagetis TaxID=2949092 RepID=A0A9X2HUQ9_9SPHN|nr:DUF4238 domain-containing protein [Sphingomonas tagetis]MCP3732995.1 DUF4238 domain-containing protein [Sphingomonas tagetis]
MNNKAGVKRTKDQHYVPRLHLRHFRGEAPKNMVWTYSKSRGTVRPSRVEETGFKRNFYSVQTDDGVYNDDLDNALSDIENKAAPVYERLLAGEIPQGQDRADFASFVATCYSRSPAMVRGYAESVARMNVLELRLQATKPARFNRLMDEMQRDTGLVVEDRDALMAFVNDPSRYHIGVSEKLGLQSVALADELAPILFRRYWNIVTAVGDAFITCDNPVYRWVPPDTVHPIYGDGGFKNGRGEVTLPLSSTKLLLIGGRTSEGDALAVGWREVEQLNRMRAAHAEEVLFADRKDDRIAALAREFANSRPRMRIGMDAANDFEVQINR